MRELNGLFMAKPDGLEQFLCKYPLDIEAGMFQPLRGPDKKTIDPGAKAVQVDQVLASSSFERTVKLKDGNLKLKAIQDKSVMVYADFTEGADPTRKHLVTTQLQLFNSGGNVRLYYLPWKEDARHTMTISDECDFFMTASMHGCRFEVRDFGGGMLSVSHSNVQPGGAEGATFDPQEMVHRLAAMDSAYAPTVLSFGKDVYFADAQRLMPHTKHVLMPMGIEPSHVKNADPGGYKANVLGSRVSGQWRFYYQLAGLFSVELHGTEVVKKKKYLGLFGTKTVVRDRVLTHTVNGETKPMTIELDLVLQVKEIWPNERTIFKR